MRRLARGRDDFDLALRGWFLSGTDKPVLEEHRQAADRIGLNLSQRMLTLNLSRRPPKHLGNSANGRSSSGPKRSRPRAAATRCPMK